ncbi:MAG: hypothetical protein LBQ48_04735, partial [Oscillospiraceae bacterium]|nr:hypothetical protein [Oscillospiraceae bacterium]
YNPKAPVSETIKKVFDPKALVVDMFTGGAGAALAFGTNELANFVGSKSAAPAVTAVPHGNSAQSTKPQHGYEIYDTNLPADKNVVKTGISGQPLNKNGTSPRANSQVNAWNKLEGNGRYAARVVETGMPNRADALAWERKNAFRLYGEEQPMSKHQIP